MCASRAAHAHKRNAGCCCAWPRPQLCHGASIIPLHSCHGFGLACARVSITDSVGAEGVSAGCQAAAFVMVETDTMPVGRGDRYSRSALAPPSVALSTPLVTADTADLAAS